MSNQLDSSFAQISLSAGEFLTRAHRGVPKFLGFWILASIVFWCDAINAQNWPQILGPDRNGRSATSLNGQDWPRKLKEVWQADLGSGYAGAAVIENMVLVPNREQDEEMLTALSLDDGKRLWDVTWPARYRGGMDSDSGPRSVCACSIEKGIALCYDASGSMACIDIKAGKLRWQRALRKEYDADDGYFGAGSSPILFSDSVIACIGGSEAGIVSLSLETGKTRWTATTYDASYSSPILVRVGNRELLVAVTRVNTLLMDPASGEVLDDIRFGSRGPTVNAATPILLEPNKLLLTASYGVGLKILEIKNDKFVELTSRKNLLSSQYNTPVLLGDRILGINGREDTGSASLVALPKSLGQSSEPLWKRPGFGMAHLIALKDDRALALTIDGELKLIDGSANDYREIASTKLPSSTYRALPALVGNRLLVRTKADILGSELLMFELK